jgi:alpha-beta hydrolase superfamily lysophospholipase
LVLRAILTKPLDWLVIQLARRHVRLGPAPPPELERLEQCLRRADFFGGSDLPRIGCPLAGSGRLAYASPVITPFPENNTVHGRWFPASDRWEGYPTAILLHGWNAALFYRYGFPLLAARLQRAGVNVAAIELPYHMQRRPRQGVVTDFISSDLERTIEASRQAIADVRVLCDWFASRTGRGVGVWGFSLGAWLAGLVAHAEPHLNFAVLTTPIARIDRVIDELPFCEPVRRSLESLSLDLRGLNLVSHQPRLDPSRILLMESRHDLFAPAETVEELWQAWGQPEIWRLSHGHISVMASVAIMRRAGQWIARKASE